MSVYGSLQASLQARDSLVICQQGRTMGAEVIDRPGRRENPLRSASASGPLRASLQARDSLVTLSSVNRSSLWARLMWEQDASLQEVTGAGGGEDGIELKWRHSSVVLCGCEGNVSQERGPDCAQELGGRQNDRTTVAKTTDAPRRPKCDPSLVRKVRRAGRLELTRPTHLDLSGIPPLLVHADHVCVTSTAATLGCFSVAGAWDKVHARRRRAASPQEATDTGGGEDEIALGCRFAGAVGMMSRQVRTRSLIRRQKDSKTAGYQRSSMTQVSSARVIRHPLATSHRGDNEKGGQPERNDSARSRDASETGPSLAIAVSSSLATRWHRKGLGACCVIGWQRRTWVGSGVVECQEGYVKPGKVKRMYALEAVEEAGPSTIATVWIAWWILDPKSLWIGNREETRTEGPKDLEY
ncbi:hypothetical protein FB45DRAFT_868079 [Roridomyces roridus]|uniref:Uncharacterized protein n=1 Tax=Roridomyces roridus TaxID=1738132 RepID=A0AAD7BPA5_9AGAR|nr:hypothetical protein FB45DRAFT_868079 [Roridomyces roridus]